MLVWTVQSQAFSLFRSSGSLYGIGSRLLDVPQGSSVLGRGLGLLTVQELNGFVEVGWTLSLALAPLSLCFCFSSLLQSNYTSLAPSPLPCSLPRFTFPFFFFFFLFVGQSNFPSAGFTENVVEFVWQTWQVWLAIKWLSPFICKFSQSCCF